MGSNIRIRFSIAGLFILRRIQTTLDPPSLNIKYVKICAINYGGIDNAETKACYLVDRPIIELENLQEFSIGPSLCQINPVTNATGILRACLKLGNYRFLPQNLQVIIH